MGTMSATLPDCLQGERIELTPLQIVNIHQHLAWNNDPELNYLDSEVPYQKETFGAFKERFERMVFRPSPSLRDFEIHAEDGTLIGVAFVTQISRHNRHCSVGVTIGNRDYWGRGYGRASMAVLLDYCFNCLEMHRVGAETFEYNTAWKNLVLGMGFRPEGIERDYLYRDGQYWDKEIFSMLEAEYRQAGHERHERREAA